MQLNFVIVILSLIACVYSQTSYKLQGQALVTYTHYRPVCEEITSSASLNVAIAAEAQTLTGLMAQGDANVMGYLVGVLNGKEATLASAFVTANTAAQASITGCGNFATAQAAVRTQIATASNASIDVVNFASAVLDKIQARTAVLLKFATVAATEIDLEIQQGFALSVQEYKAFCNNQTGAAYVALQGKIASSTVTAADLQLVLLDLAAPANGALATLLLTAKATANVLTALKAQLSELPRAVVVDANLKAKATAVTAAEATASIKVKAREFFAAKAAKVVHVFADFVAVFGADVNATLRVTLTKRLRDMCWDELSAYLADISDVTIATISATGSVQIDISITALPAVNLTALQENLRLVVLGFVNAHVHPLKVDVSALSSTGITVLVHASGAVNGDPAPKTMCTDDTGDSAKNTFITNVNATINANADVDFNAVLATAQLGIGTAITAIDTALTAVGTLITTIDTNLKAAVTATLNAFANVHINLVADATVNFQTETFAVVDLQARAKLAASACAQAYSTLLLRVQQDLVDLNITGQYVIRLEATIKKQLLNAINDRFTLIGGVLGGCTLAGSIQVNADFNETDIDALVQSNAACASAGAIYARILSLKRQLLAAIVARKAHATLEASVKTSVDAVVTKYTAIQTKLSADISASANFTVTKSAAAIKAVWIDAQADFKARVAACLAVLGKGVFGASISIDISAAASGTLKHTATCTDIDLSASAKAAIEIQLAAYLPICIVQSTGGDGSYCQGKSTVNPTKKRATGASASQTTTDPQATTTASTSQSTGQSTSSQSTSSQSTSAQSTSSQSTSSPVTPGSNSNGLVLSVLLVFVAIASNYFM